MAHTHPLLVEAIAEQLIVELQAYESLLEDMRRARWPTDAAVAVAAHGDRVLRCAENLPHLPMRAAEFLITRTMLSRRLVGSGHGRDEALAALHTRHLRAVDLLRSAAAARLGGLAARPTSAAGAGVTSSGPASSRPSSARC